MYQIRAEQIEFVIQSDEPTHQFVLHLAVHQFIVLFYPYRDFVFDQIFRIASLISTFVSPVRLATIAVTQLGAYNVDHLERCKIKDPSLNNWPALVEAVQGNIIADFPVINKSFNLSYSGTDR